MLPAWRELLSDPPRVVAMCTWIASAGVLLITLQQLWNWRLFRVNEVLSWRLFRSRRRFTQVGVSAWVFDRLFEFPQYLLVLVIRAGSAGALLVLNQARFM